MPVILISGTVGEEEAVRCLHIGTADYLLKQRLDRLGPAVQRAIEEAESRRRRKHTEYALLEREQALRENEERTTVALAAARMGVWETRCFRSWPHSAIALTAHCDQLSGVAITPEKRSVQEARGAIASGRILHRLARGQCLESPTREHSMAPLTVVPRGLRLPLARQGLARFPHSRSSTSRSGPRVHQANTVPNL